MGSERPVEEGMYHIIIHGYHQIISKSLNVLETESTVGGTVQFFIKSTIGSYEMSTYKVCHQIPEFENQGSYTECSPHIHEREPRSLPSFSGRRMKVEDVFKFSCFNLNIAILFGKSFLILQRAPDFSNYALKYVFYMKFPSF